MALARLGVLARNGIGSASPVSDAMSGMRGLSGIRQGAMSPGEETHLQSRFAIAQREWGRYQFTVVPQLEAKIRTLQAEINRLTSGGGTTPPQ